jgi:hypothetical protein
MAWPTQGRRGLQRRGDRDTASATGQKVQLGRRTPADTTKTTITNLDRAEAYTVEVRSLAGPRMSEAFVVTPAPRAPGDTTPPTLSADPPTRRRTAPRRSPRPR